MSPLNIHYPKGQGHDCLAQSNSLRKNGRQAQIKYGNRGMTLEEDIKLTNEYYRANQIAVIHKKPTPIQVVKVDYPKRSAAKITEAYYRRPSTTDFNGVYKGKYIDFEAKETQIKNYLPLKNFHDHQIQHMMDCQRMGGICFIIVRFKKKAETYLYPASKLFEWWQQRNKANSRQSIPYSDFEKNGTLISLSYAPRLPYLEALDDFANHE